MKNNSEKDFLISEEITQKAREGMGLYFNKINLIDPDTLVTDMLNPMRPIRAHEILSRYVDTRGKKILEIGSGYGVSLVSWTKKFDLDVTGAEPEGEGFSDTVELKSGQIFTDVLTIVEPNTLLIYKEDGQKEEIPKSELKRITLKKVSWKNKESLDNATQSSDSTKTSSDNSKDKENPPSLDNKKEATISSPKNQESTIDKPKAEIVNNYMGLFVQASIVNWQVGGIDRKSTRLNSSH